MFAQSVDGQLVDILQALFDVVGVERGQGAYFFDVLAAQRENVGVGADGHGEVSVVGAHLWEELLQSFTHANGTGTGTAAAMGRGEGLVEVDVHHVETHVARSGCAQHGVQVGAVVVHQSAASVD